MKLKVARVVYEVSTGGGGTSYPLKTFDTIGDAIKFTRSYIDSAEYMNDCIDKLEFDVDFTDINKHTTLNNAVASVTQNYPMITEMNIYESV